MATPITLYFDLVSPYAWLALHAVDAIQQATGRAVIVTPVAFGAILKRHGQPAPVEVPGKRAQIFDDIRWRAAERGLPFTGPPAHPFNPLHGLRLCLAVTDPARRAVLARQLADAAWSQGRDQAQVVLDVAGACGLPETWARAQIADPGIKQALIAPPTGPPTAACSACPPLRSTDACSGATIASPTCWRRRAARVHPRREPQHGCASRRILPRGACRAITVAESPNAPAVSASRHDRSGETRTGVMPTDMNLGLRCRLPCPEHTTP